MMKWAGLLVAIWALACGAVAQQTIDNPNATVSLLSDRSAVAPGESFQIALDIAPKNGWHIYWRNPGDAGLPPVINWTETSGASIGQIEWPAPHELPVVPGEIMDYGYDSRTAFLMPISAPDTASGQLTVSGEVSYLICKDICVPENAELSLALPIGGEGFATGSDTVYLAGARSALPRPLPGEARYSIEGDRLILSVQSSAVASPNATLRYFPIENEIIHSSEQLVRFGDEGATLTLAADDEYPPQGVIRGVVTVEGDGPRRAFAVEAMAGAILSGTGGVASSGIASVAGPAAAPFSLPLVIGLALLGGLILNLMPCVLPVLSIKAFGIVNAAASGHQSELRAHGLWYTAGVLLSFAAIAGIFLAVRAGAGAATLGFQLQHAPTVIVLALVLFVIGLWLVGMFELGGSIMNTGSGLASRGGPTGAFFTGVLAAVVGAPCIGPFLGAALGAVASQPALSVVVVFMTIGLGLALPFLAISFAPGLHKLLPKPGAWMETLKQFFAFPMFLSAAWLLAVLGALTDYAVVGWTVAGAALLVFGIWLLQKRPGGSARQAVTAFAAIAIIGGLAVPIWQAVKPAPRPISANAIEADWSPSYRDELLAEGKGVFVDFTAVWCQICQVNKLSTLSRRSVRETFAANDVAFLTADFTRMDQTIAEELARYGSPGVPLYLYYPPGQTEAQVLSVNLSPDYVIGIIEGRS